MNEDNSYHTISKTSDIIGVQSHVLRFWEKKFYNINPKKSISGRRYYSTLDIKYLLEIKKLLYKDGYTIKGAINYINKKYKNKNDTVDNSNTNILEKAISLIKDGSSLINKHLD